MTKASAPPTGAGAFRGDALNEKDSEKADPLQLERWEFYVLPTSRLDESCGEQKTISLASLLKLNPLKTDYHSIEAAVIRSIVAP